MAGPPAAGAAPPSLALGQFLATAGLFPAPGLFGDTQFVLGTIHSYAGGGQGSWTASPFGMPHAQGQLLPIMPNAALYSIMGNAYGGTVPQTFGVPDLAGHAATHRGPAPAPVGTTPLLWVIATDGAAAGPPVQPAPRAPKLPPGFPQPPTPAAPTNWVSAAPLTGMVAMFAGQDAPGGWLACDGSLIDQSAHPKLFAVLGNAFGWQSATRVALPNLTGNVVIGPPEGVVPGQTRPWQPGDSFQTVPPALVLNWLICVQGLYPQGNGQQPTGGPPSGQGWLGQVIAYAGKDIPPGWMACDGSLLSIADHQELFVLLQNQWGGDGEMTFALPDLRGTIMVGS